MASRFPYRAPVRPARAAYSHSASVGKRPPPHSQKLRASLQVMATAGIVSSGFASFNFRPMESDAARAGLPAAVRYRFQAPDVTGVCPIQKPLAMFTSWAGFSSSLHSLSPGEHPIVNLPGGTNTYFRPSRGFTLDSPPRGALFATGGATSGWKGAGGGGVTFAGALATGAVATAGAGAGLTGFETAGAGTAGSGAL